jgi:hypothetical protein
MSSLLDALYTLLVAEKARASYAQQNFNYKGARTWDDGLNPYVTDPERFMYIPENWDGTVGCTGVRQGLPHGNIGCTGGRHVGCQGLPFPADDDHLQQSEVNIVLARGVAAFHSGSDRRSYQDPCQPDQATAIRAVMLGKAEVAKEKASRKAEREAEVAKQKASRKAEVAKQKEAARVEEERLFQLNQGRLLKQKQEKLQMIDECQKATAARKRQLECQKEAAREAARVEKERLFQLEQKQKEGAREAARVEKERLFQLNQGRLLKQKQEELQMIDDCQRRLKTKRQKQQESRNK